MKIAQVCPEYYPYIGGVESHVEEISRRLSRRGLEVEVLTTDPDGGLPKEENIDGVTIKRFGSYAPSNAFFFSRSLKKFLAQNSNGYDIIHAHNYHALPALYAAQEKQKNRLVFTPHYHGKAGSAFRNFPLYWYRYFGKFIFKQSDRLIFVSEFERSLALRNFSVDIAKSCVISNGVDSEIYDKVEKPRLSSNCILYVGRLEKTKGVQYAIAALPYLENNLYLEIIGNGPYKNSLLRLSKKLGVEKRTVFRDNVSRSDLVSKYRHSKVFVMPSGLEAYCISVAEALASGTPCVVARSSALVEWIDNRNCFGVDYPINPRDLARAICLAMNSSVRDVHIKSWNQVAEEHISVYEKLIKR